jgi:hypothetical protein
MTQIMKLLDLAPDIQEPGATSGAGFLGHHARSGCHSCREATARARRCRRGSQEG